MSFTSQAQRPKFGQRLLLGPAQLAGKYQLCVFFALAYAISWTLFLPMVVRGVISPPLIVLASFAPSIAAVVTHRLATGSYRAFRIVATWPRLFIGTIAGCTLVVLTYVVIPGLVAADPQQLHWGILVSTGVYDASTLLGGPLGEEPGWRGYALPRLERRVGPVLGSVVIALAWVGWHLPLFLVPGWTSAPLWTYILILTGVSTILTFSVNVARFSVVAAIITHAAFNTVSRFLVGLFAGVQPHVQMSMVTLLALAGLGTALCLIAVTRGRLGYVGPDDY